MSDSFFNSHNVVSSFRLIADKYDTFFRIFFKRLLRFLISAVFVSMISSLFLHSVHWKLKQLLLAMLEVDGHIYPIYEGDAF